MKVVLRTYVLEMDRGGVIGRDQLRRRRLSGRFMGRGHVISWQRDPRDLAATLGIRPPRCLYQEIMYINPLSSSEKML